jgi:alditol oxidase
MPGLLAMSGVPFSGGGRVRAVGIRHSFNDLAGTTGTLVSVSGMEPGPVPDPGARTVTIGAGATYGALAGWLEEQGWALANMHRRCQSGCPGASAR